MSFRPKQSGVEKSVIETKSGNGEPCELIDLSTSSRGHNGLSFRVQGNGIEKSIIETKSGNGEPCELIDLSTSSRGHNVMSFRPKGNGVEKSAIKTKSGNGKYGEFIDLSTSSRGQTLLSLRAGHGANKNITSIKIPLNEGESEERVGEVCAKRPVLSKTGLGRKSPHGPLKTNYGKLAFTLVELIVVIVIVGVLATVGFLAFADYPKQARDVVRISNLKEIEKALEFYKIKDGDFPIPTGGQTNTGTIEGYTGIVWHKGTFGEDLVNQIQEITKLPIDPKDNTEYTYELTEDLQSYRLTANLEIKNQDTGTKKYVAKNKIVSPISCKDILEQGKSTGNKVYTIYPSGKPTNVYCDMTNGGWTLAYRYIGTYANNNLFDNENAFGDISDNTTTEAKLSTVDIKNIMRVNKELKLISKSHSPEKTYFINYKNINNLSLSKTKSYVISLRDNSRPAGLWSPFYETHLDFILFSGITNNIPIPGGSSTLPTTPDGIPYSRIIYGLHHGTRSWLSYNDVGYIETWQPFIKRANNDINAPAVGTQTLSSEIWIR